MGRSLRQRTKTSGDSQVDSQLWQSALDEVSSGWLCGPFYDDEDVKDCLGLSHFHLSRRFPLCQGDKIRPIDDLCESNVNAAYSACEKLWLMDTDYITTAISQLERVLQGDLVNLIDATGCSHEIRTHPFWKQSSMLWKGRTIDLKSAYKQLHVKPTNRWTSCIVMFDPDKACPAVFVQNTLPFGSSSSVLSFNRFSRAIWAMGAKFLKRIWFNFYDDYPVLRAACSATVPYTHPKPPTKIEGESELLDIS